MPELQRKATSGPDEVREVPQGRFEIFELGDGAVARTILQPGFRWSESMKQLRAGR